MSNINEINEDNMLPALISSFLGEICFRVGVWMPHVFPSS